MNGSNTTAYASFRCRKKRLLAFTLVELLAAFIVLSGLVVMLTTVLNSASQAWLNSSANIEVAQSARITLDLINRDLNSVYVNSAYPMTYTNSGLLFYSAVANPSGAWDLCRLQYYVVNRSLIREVLYVASPGSSVTASGTSELTPTLWNLGSTSGLSLAYYLPDGASTTAASGTTTVPSRVFVQLRLLDEARLKNGSTLQPTGTFETSVFLLQGFVK